MATAQNAAHRPGLLMRERYHGARFVYYRLRGMPEIPFGPYTLLRRLAIGGMAEVYLARMSGPRGFEKLVVVKQILPQLAEDPELLQMFHDESAIASKLSHPGIVQIIDFGKEGGTFYLAMEHVDGLDLHALLRTAKHETLRATIPVPFALRVAIDLARAVHGAHEARDTDGTPLEVVHRDISPQNVLLSRAGAVKLADFGIARARTRAVRTATGVLRGKIAYVAPEVFGGARPDRRADVYGLGLVLFECLAGTKPFDGDDAALIKRVVREDPPRLDAVWREADPKLADVVRKAIARDPKQRFQTAEAFADALERLGGASGTLELGEFVAEMCARRERRLAQEEEQARPRPAPTATLARPATETLAGQLAAVEDATGARDGDETEIAPLPFKLSASNEPDRAPTRPASQSRRRLHRLFFAAAAALFAAIVWWVHPAPEPERQAPAPSPPPPAQASLPPPVTSIAPVTIRVDPEPEPEPEPSLEARITPPRRPTAPPPPPRRPRPEPKKVSPPPVEQEPEGFGELSIDTDPWSYVTIGDDALGATPLAHVRLRAGRHRVRLHNPEQGLSRTVKVFIKADDRLAVRVRLADGKIMQWR